MKEKYILKIKNLAKNEITDVEYKNALTFVQKKKIAVFIVAYNAEKYLKSVISRIPEDVGKLLSEIIIIDDCSLDDTYKVGKELLSEFNYYNINIYKTPFNRGYGGNQKLGYFYCIKKKYDYVILLHGDGQYSPEYIPKIISVFANSEKEDVDAVFASRMINKKQALNGGMPLYKLFGNQILTYIENKLLNLNLSEFHTGFRAYKIKSLEKIPFEFNSDNFHFDTEIIIQAKAMNWQIKEISLPAYYGDEKCRVNGIKYALNCIKSVIRYKLVTMGLYYKRNFDFGIFEDDNYQYKKSPYSLHQFIINQFSNKESVKSVEFGANKGILSNHIASKVDKHYAVDMILPEAAENAIKVKSDLNTDFTNIFENEKFDYCIALDTIEHLDSPEDFLKKVFKIMKTNGKLFISTANVAYLPIRFSLLAGQLNYGKRGILDMTHKRLFTINSFKKLIKQYGFKIEKITGFTPPLTDLVSNGFIMIYFEKFHFFLSNFWKNMFAYNFLIEARRMDSLEEIFDKTIKL